MGWQDRDYNDGGDSAGEYLSNPAGLMGYSVPFGTWFGVRVRLHFWLLLAFLFTAVDVLRGQPVWMLLLIVLMTLTALMCHDFGHRILTQYVGGSHDEFMLWPPGGMIFPRVPPYPLASFAGHVGGIAANLLLALLSLLAIVALDHAVPRFIFTIVSLLDGAILVVPQGTGDWYRLISCLAIFSGINLSICALNLVPSYWFDGGFLLEAILWPWTGLRTAINVTCIVCMCIAGPMALLSLYSHNFLGLAFWVLIFSASYVKRRSALSGEGNSELDDQVAYSAKMGQGGRVESASRRGRMPRWPSRDAVKEAKARKLREQRIDAILDKVRSDGMQSLNWRERRALRQATEEQRRREKNRK